MNTDNVKLKKLGASVDADIEEVITFVEEKAKDPTSWNTDDHNEAKSYFRFLSDKQDKLLVLMGGVEKLLAFVHEQEREMHELIPNVFDKIVKQIRKDQ